MWEVGYVGMMVGDLLGDRLLLDRNGGSQREF